MSVDVEPIPAESLLDKAKRITKEREERSKIWVQEYNKMAASKGLPSWEKLLENQKIELRIRAEAAKRKQEREERQRANGGNSNYVHCRKRCKDFKRCGCWKKSFEDQMLCYKQRCLDSQAVPPGV
jgi:hypothetical protein